MSEHQFAIFDTAIGRCGIVWGERGITSVQLPMGDENKTRARLRQRHDDLIETPPGCVFSGESDGEVTSPRPFESSTSASTKNSEAPFISG